MQLCNYEDNAEALKDFKQELDTIRFIYLGRSSCLQWKNTLEGGYIRGMAIVKCCQIHLNK